MADDLTPEQRRRIEALLQPKRTGRVRNASEITPRRAVFLWWPYLPLGKVVIVAGAPGHGKSQLAALITGLATRAALYPGDVREPSRVLLMCAEDDAGDTVVPRLLAVNADLRLVDMLDMVTEYPGGLTSEGMIRLPTDSGLVHDWARAHVDARLVVMDPVASFFERSHSPLFNHDVRDALGPLVAIAGSYGITVVIILHLNKSESRDFMNRIAESHGFQALARSVLALGPDPDDPDGTRGSRKVIAITKANLVKPGTYGLRCEVRSVTLGSFTPPIETSELALIGKCEISGDDLLMPSAERTVRLEAAEWLEQFVGDRWVKVGDVRKAGISDGIHWRLIDKIARERNYKRAKQPGVKHGPWWIGAPTTDLSTLARTCDPGTGNLESLESLDGSNPDNQDTQGTQESSYPGDTREGELGNDARPIDLDEYRKWEQRRLGERDDEDDEP